MSEATLPVGRELDAAVAEKVMGLTVKWGTWYDGGPQPFIKDDLGLNWEPVDSYSTDIAAAMDVLCKARGGGSFCIRSIGDRYACTMYGKARGEGSTISEAICRAALAAVG